MAHTLLIYSVAFWLIGAPIQMPTPEAIVGKWLTKNGESRVEIYKQGGRYFGKNTFLKEADQKKYKSLDDPILYKDFVYEKGKYQNGTVTDPGSGKRYKSELILEEGGDQLTFKVVWGLMSFKETWTREK